MKSLGVTVLAREDATEYAYRYRIQYDGDMKKLADFIGMFRKWRSCRLAMRWS